MNNRTRAHEPTGLGGLSRGLVCYCPQEEEPGETLCGIQAHLTDKSSAEFPNRDWPDCTAADAVAKRYRPWPKGLRADSLPWFDSPLVQGASRLRYTDKAQVAATGPYWPKGARNKKRLAGLHGAPTCLLKLNWKLRSAVPLSKFNNKHSNLTTCLTAGHVIWKVGGPLTMEGSM